MDEKNLYNSLFDEDDSIENRSSKKIGLSKSSSNVIIAGVCGGIAEYLNKDVKLIRFISLLIALLGWFPFFIYLILAFSLPAEKKILSNEEIIRINHENNITILAGLFIYLGFYTLLTNFNFSTNNFVFFENEFLLISSAIIFGGLILIDKIKLPFLNYYNINFIETQKNEKMFLGVCRDFSNYLSVDINIIRTIFLIFTILTIGLFAFFYFIIYFLSKADVVKQ
ncbi:MAG: PspC domain-containing protein [Melioribacteraceae bacterium]|nr:PspC domain-containing protein [Melioribacteraceae bacterium]